VPSEVRHKIKAHFTRHISEVIPQALNAK